MNHQSEAHEGASAFHGEIDDTATCVKVPIDCDRPQAAESTLIPMLGIPILWDDPSLVDMQREGSWPQSPKLLELCHLNDEIGLFVGVGRAQAKSVVLPPVVGVMVMVMVMVMAMVVGMAVGVVWAAA